MPDFWGLLSTVSSLFSGHSSVTLLLTAVVSTGLLSYRGFLNWVGLWETLEPYRPYVLIAFIVFSVLTAIKFLVYLVPRVGGLIKRRFCDRFWERRRRAKCLRHLSAHEKDILMEYIGEEGKRVNFFYSKSPAIQKLWEEKGVLEIVSAPPHAGGGPEMEGYQLSDWAKRRIEKDPGLLSKEHDREEQVEKET